MLKYKCLVLDHDDTVMQSEKTLCYPCFVQTMARIRPGIHVTLEMYINDCHTMGFCEMCRIKYGFTEEELAEEYLDWKEYVKTHIAEPYEGIAGVIQRHKAAGGLVCVVSHSSEAIITRDYHAYIGLLPDAIYGCDYPAEQQKPNIYPLQAIMEKYGLSPDDLLVLDDSKIGYDMAAAAGVKIGFAAWSKAGFESVMDQMRNLCDFTFYTVADFEDFLFT